MLIRALAGLLIGASYGVLVFGIEFLRIRPDLVKSNAGMIIIGSAGLAWLAVYIGAIIAGVCGALVGLIVGLARLSSRNAAVLGFATGFLLFVGLSLSSGPPRLPTSPHEWAETLVLFAILPLGLGLLGCVAAIVGERLSRFGLNS